MFPAPLLAGVLAQETPTPTLAPVAPSPAASSSPPPPSSGGGGGVDLSKLTPQQQAAVQAQIIKDTQNPVGNIAVIPFQNNMNYAIGPYARFQYNLNIQPVVPFMLTKQLNLIARTIIPLVDQPSSLPPNFCVNADCGSTFGLGDIQEQLYFAPKTKPGALIWGAGPIFQFPTAQPQTLGSAKWSAGPAAVALVTPGRWVAGILLTQLWSFAGRPNYPNVNSGLFQPFLNYNLPGQWTLTTAPIITVNYNAPGNQKWAVPIGGGGGKTFKLGDQVMQINVFYYTFIQKPLSAPQTNLRVVWSLVYPVKRGVDIQQIIQNATKQ